MKFMIEWIATRLCASVLGRSVPQDKHPRGWQLPWRLRVAHRLALTLAATD
jgi:hypothetical protein